MDTITQKIEKQIGLVRFRKELERSAVLALPERRLIENELEAMELKFSVPKQTVGFAFPKEAATGIACELCCNSEKFADWLFNTGAPRYNFIVHLDPLWEPCAASIHGHGARAVFLLIQPEYGILTLERTPVDDKALFRPVDTVRALESGPCAIIREVLWEEIEKLPRYQAIDAARWNPLLRRT